MFRGVYTALVTPFNTDGSIDTEAMMALVEEQIQSGIHGLVPVGSTGESPTVSHEENMKVVEMVINKAAGRIPVIAGTGSNSTQEAVSMTKAAKAMGASASLQVVPYYNKPNQEGMYRHFMTLADSIDLPMIVYNIPGRTGVNMNASTLARLAKHPNIAAVKESSGNLNQAMEIIASVPEGFGIFCGDDNWTFPLLSLGATGVISVASHLVPKELVALYEALQKSDLQTAKAIHYRLLPLFNAVFIDTNPIPIKYMLSRLGKIKEAYRLPLLPLNDDAKKSVDVVLKAQNLL